MAEPRLGGHPPDARLQAATPGAVAKPTRLSTPDAVLKSGGVPYEGGEECNTLKKDGGRCLAKPTATGRCMGHEKQYRAANP